MSLIGKKLGINKSDNTIRNSEMFLKGTLKIIGVCFNTKEIRKKNLDFNNVLLNFVDDYSYFETYLSIKGYKLIKIFRREKDLLEYIKKERIKTKIKAGYIFVGNIYDTNNILICNGFVLAEKTNNTNKEIDDILFKK